MQQSTMKILRTKSNQLYCFYTYQNNLYLKEHNYTGNLDPELIIQDILPRFSVSISQDNILTILVQDLQGRVWLGKKSETGWEKKLWLEHFPYKGQTCDLYFHMEEKQALLLYNQPTSDTPVQQLVYTINQNGSWSSPKESSRLLPMGQVSYTIYEISENHILLCYLTPEGSVVAQEVLLSPFQTGTSSVIIQAGSQCMDFNLLPTEDCIHILYVVKKGSGRQLVYKNKIQQTVSPAFLIFEGMQIDNCSLLYSGSVLLAFFTMHGQLYFASSYDNGKQFSPVKRYPTPPLNSLQKCSYFSSKTMRHKATSLYCANGNTLFLQKELSEDFYPPVTVTAKTPAENQIFELMEENSRLQEKISHLESELLLLKKNYKSHPPNQ